jgi:RNA polymerase sigma-70 factor (ECF subfamily)
LIRQLQTGNKQAFRQVYDDYYEMLLYVANQYLKDRDEAKEAVQDAFVKLWVHREGIKPDFNIKNYLYTIVKNNSLNIIKKQEFIYRSHEDIRWMEMHYHYEAMSRLGFDSIEFKELQQMVEEAINHLPEHCRNVFRLSRISQLKNKEIASQLGVSEKTVEAHMTKAIKLLKKELGGYLSLFLFLSEQFF